MSANDAPHPAVCPVYVRLPVMTHRWGTLTFLHWRYDAADVQRLLPPGLEVETFDGSAWVGLVPFHMRVSLPPGAPAAPWAGRFCETNVRTYVRDRKGRSGIWFFSLDAERLGPVLGGRTTYQLLYFWSRMRMAVEGDRVAYSCSRRWPGAAAHSRVVIEHGEAFEPGELTLLDHFLTARWVLFGGANGPHLFARAWHQPWPLRRASVLACEDGLVQAAGLPAPAGEPLVHYSPGVDVRVGRPERV